MLNICVVYRVWFLLFEFLFSYFPLILGSTSILIGIDVFYSFQVAGLILENTFTSILDMAGVLLPFLRWFISGSGSKGTKLLNFLVRSPWSTIDIIGEVSIPDSILLCYTKIIKLLKSQDGFHMQLTYSIFINLVFRDYWIYFLIM